MNELPIYMNQKSSNM